jgi:membrane protease YdiL (CAAX protease family)
MTAGVALPTRQSIRTLSTAERVLQVAMAVAGCALLLARPLFPTTGALLALFAALLAVGVAWPTARAAAAHPLAVVAVFGVGVGAFALGRLAGGGLAPGPLAVRLIVLNSLAAVAEEAFFRRFVYGLLQPHGAAVAVAGSAILFAFVHVSVYGFWVLPVDLAAGVLLGWQRSASGTWAVPALTHVLANVLVVI